MTDSTTREVRLHRCDDLARDERDEARRAAQSQQPLGPVRNRASGIVTSEYDAFRRTHIVQARMVLPTALITFLAAPEAQPGQVAMTVQLDNDRPSDDCRALEVLAGDRLDQWPAQSASGNQIVFRAELEQLSVASAASPLRMRACGVELRFSGGQLETIRRFLSEISEHTPASSDGDNVAPPSDGVEVL